MSERFGRQRGDAHHPPRWTRAARCAWSRLHEAWVRLLREPGVAEEVTAAILIFFDLLVGRGPWRQIALRVASLLLDALRRERPIF